MRGMLRGLTARELGGRIVYLPSVDSTNRYLKENGDSLPHGTVCYTGWQQAGRGRLGRSWNARDGQALAMSVLFKTDADTAPLPLICGMAVTVALRGLCGGNFQIKWPNDIVCGGYKVCGILCENRWMSGGGFTVAGIGVNLEQSAEEFRLLGLPYAGSVKMVTGSDLDAEVTAAAVINALEPLWFRLKESGFAALRGEYEALCATVGRSVRVLSPDGEVLREGRAAGITEDGRLLVESGGESAAVNAGEVSVRGLEGYL